VLPHEVAKVSVVVVDGLGHEWLDVVRAMRGVVPRPEVNC
jgi:hypothetical protein